MATKKAKQSKQYAGD